ncbi:MAG TPA: hypothetical protein VEQ58_23865 [Polyangiaceae bacterium]|nr:hypothetical protein [Polyangiaceae bacterium]
MLLNDSLAIEIAAVLLGFASATHQIAAAKDGNDSAAIDRAATKDKLDSGPTIEQQGRVGWITGLCFGSKEGWVG